MGAPDRHAKLAEKLCGDFNVILKAGKEEISIKYGCGVRQGDNLTPTLLIIVMQLVAEEIIKHMIFFMSISTIKVQVEEGDMKHRHS